MGQIMLNWITQNKALQAHFIASVDNYTALVVKCAYKANKTV